MFSPSTTYHEHLKLEDFSLNLCQRQLQVFQWFNRPIAYYIARGLGKDEDHDEQARRSSNA